MNLKSIDGRTKNKDRHQSIDFTEAITPQIKSKIKISGINVLDAERINKRILQDIEWLRSVEENIAQKTPVLSNTYFKI